MNYSKFHSANPSESVGKWIDNLFNTTLADVMGSDFSLSNPSVNIEEHEDHFDMHLAAPGLAKSDFSIQIEGDNLVISADKKTESEDTGNKKYTRREFNYTSFKRSFHLDDKINREGISAQYENGVLILKLPKKDESWKKPSATTIEIK